VVVTFTTTPDRIAHIDVMLKSILDQTVLPDKIYLCIPELSRRTQSEYPIPDWFKDIPLLEIIKTPKDLGPITKLIPTWLKERENGDTRIIIVDDDHVYSRYLVESLVLWSERLPEAALGCSGVLVPSGYLPSDVIYAKKDFLRDLRLISSHVNALSRIDYLFGYAGVLLRPKFLNDDILDYSNAPKGAFFEDDLWISGHLAQANIDRYVISSPNERLMPGSCKSTSDTAALCLEENKGGENMDAVYKYLLVSKQDKKLYKV